MAAKVKLGRCQLLSSNTNYLHQSFQICGKIVENVQPCELAWTDGERVWLSPLDFNSNGREDCFNAREPSLVGEFGSFVLGVSCSAVTEESSGFYIAVILKEKIVVLFRKIGEPVVKLVKEYFDAECLPRGCEWHPSLPLLSVLSKTSAVLLRFSEELECTSTPIQTSYRNLQTCAWSNNGRCLAVAVEDSLCIFSWTDLNKPNQFSFVQWSSLELTGKIKCIAPWQTFSFMIATELPLDKLCGKNENDGDLFEVENVIQAQQGQSSCNESTNKISDTKDTGFTILTAKSDKDFTSLLKLKLRKQIFEVPATLAQIIVICCEDKKPRDICRTSIDGLLSPDLLIFQPLTNTVLVGSHCCSKLYCYSLLQCSPNGKIEFKAKEKMVELDLNSKPKGTCLIPGQPDRFLVLLGKTKEMSNMVAFPPSTATEQYDVSLRCFSASLYDDNVTKSMDSFDEQKSSDQCSNQGEVLAEGDSSPIVVHTELSPSLRLPDGTVFNGFTRVVETEKSSLISELQLTDDSELFGNSKEMLQGKTDLCGEIKHQQGLGDHSSCFKHIQEVQTAMMEALSQINEMVSKLEKRMVEIHSNKAEENKHTLYPFTNNAEFVSVVWTDELTGAVEQETFLLDKGRLKLKTIQQAFNASLVRISVGDVPCIVSSGEDGFIPVRFISGSTVQMSGHSNHLQNSE